MRAMVPVLLLLFAACQATGETPPAPSSPTGGSGLPDPTQASSSPSDSGGDVPAPAPGEPLTEAHSGATVELAGDASASLQLSSEWAWDLANQVGDSVEAVPVSFAQDPGFYEWEIQPRAAGESALQFIGNSNCGDTVVCPPREVEFRFLVTD